MIELQTEVCLAVIDSFLDKKIEERTEKHSILVKEAILILEGKMEQLSEKDNLLLQRAIDEGLS